MQTISATYRVTTPMFLGGAEHQAELRLPSFKGALRFWWRALAWVRCKDVRRLHEEEMTLFGSSDEQVGQSKVLLRLVPCAAGPKIRSARQQLMDSNHVVGDGARYLGYGVMEAFASRKKDTKEGELTRPCLLAPFTFTVELLFKPGTKQHQREQVEYALKALGILGGLGSKSRKGYGSLTLTSLTVRQGEDKPTERWNPPNNPQELEQAIRGLLGPSQVRAGDASDSVFNNLPDWTAFSPASRVVVLAADHHDSTPLALLDRVGREMIRYRSWGRGGRVFGAQSEKNFANDHDTMRDYLSAGQAPTHAPQRAVFGLPHNYYFGSLSRGRDLQVKADVTASSHDRRGSPLFFHVHDSGAGSPLAVITFLPACFLPEGEQVRIADTSKDRSLNRRRRPSVEIPMASDLWEPIGAFLDRLLDPNQRKEAFGEALEVTHG